MRSAGALAILFATFTFATERPLVSAPGPPTTSGALRVVRADGAIVEMPLRHTKVEIEVTASVARATIEQRFGNPFLKHVDAVYTFPLGEHTHVRGFQLVSGLRTVRNEIRLDDDPRGFSDEPCGTRESLEALVEDSRNTFTQVVSRLRPRTQVTVRLDTVWDLSYERGVHTLTFPLVGPENRRSRDVEVNVTIDAGVPLTNLASPSHGIDVHQTSRSSATIRLAANRPVPNRDFVLTWSVGGDKPAVGYLAHRDGPDGFFTLVVQPKGDVDPAETAPRELVFVLDASGSMRGIPGEASRRFIAKTLRALGPRDTFNVVRFASKTKLYSSVPVPADPGAVESAIAWLPGPQDDRESLLVPGMKAALAGPADPERRRIVVVLTDGCVGDDAAALVELAQSIGPARVDTIGIGAPVRPYVLERMAELGHGAHVLVRSDGAPDGALDAIVPSLSGPYVTELAIDWGALPVADLAPATLPDLLPGQNLTVVGRYWRGGRGDVVVRGRAGGRPFEERLHIVLPEREQRNAALASVWGLARLAEMFGDAAGSTSLVREESIAVALACRLPSNYTSELKHRATFLEVDETIDCVTDNPAEDIVDHDFPRTMPSRRYGTHAIPPPAHDTWPVFADASPMLMSSTRLVLPGSRQGDLSPYVADRLRDAVFRILADLAEDGKLSSIDGKPALAALLDGQGGSGEIAGDVELQAIATWALSEAARNAPGDSSISRASTEALAYLAQRVRRDRSPELPNDDTDAEGMRWGRLVLGWMRPASADAIPELNGDPGKSYALLVEAIDAAKRGVPPPDVPGRSPFERLVRAIGRGHLKVAKVS